MIRTFADRRTQDLFESGTARGVPADVTSRAARKLHLLHAAGALAELCVPPGNRLHALHGNRLGQYAIAVNDRWRICFRFEEGDAFDVEFCDYH